MANTVIGKTKTNIPVQGSDNMSSIADSIAADASGNVTTKGYIKPGAYELDEDLNIRGLPTGISTYYAHARVSNGKLSLVIFLGTTAEIPSGYSLDIFDLELSSSILSKLHPFSSNYLDSKITFGGYEASPTAVKLNIQKGETSIQGNLYYPVIPANSAFRFEINFLL